MGCVDQTPCVTVTPGWGEPVVLGGAVAVASHCHDTVACLRPSYSAFPLPSVSRHWRQVSSLWRPSASGPTFRVTLTGVLPCRWPLTCRPLLSL